MKSPPAPPGAWQRPTKVASLASSWCTASGSTGIPPISRRARLSTRMSAKNTPCVGLVSKSPVRLLRQNVCPSTRVISSVGSPRLEGCPASTHGLGFTPSAVMRRRYPARRAHRPPRTRVRHSAHGDSLEPVPQLPRQRPCGDGLLPVRVRRRSDADDVRRSADGRRHRGERQGPALHAGDGGRPHADGRRHARQHGARRREPTTPSPSAGRTRPSCAATGTSCPAAARSPCRWRRRRGATPSACASTSSACRGW